MLLSLLCRCIDICFLFFALHDIAQQECTNGGLNAFELSVPVNHWAHAVMDVGGAIKSLLIIMTARKLIH